jgi:hypothetical protein
MMYLTFAGGVPQVLECLTSKCEALSSNPNNKHTHTHTHTHTHKDYVMKNAPSNRQNKKE